jgi:hypothetical protein
MVFDCVMLCMTDQMLSNGVRWQNIVFHKCYILFIFQSDLLLESVLNRTYVSLDYGLKPPFLLVDGPSVINLMIQEAGLCCSNPRGRNCFLWFLWLTV